MLVKLNEIPLTKSVISAFGGYNHNPRISQGELYDMKNLSANKYPLLSPRGKREAYKSGVIRGIIGKDELCYIDGSKFVIGNTSYEMNLSATVPKQLVSMGSYVIIMPDKKYINTKNPTDRGSIEISYESVGTVTYTMSTLEGNSYQDVTVSSSAPAAQNGKYWIDSSSNPHVLKQYTSASNQWVSIATTYVKIQATNIAKDIGIGDGVKITGVNHPQIQSLNDTTSLVWGSNHTEDGSGDYIIVVGIIDTATTQSTPIRIERYMPDMDFVIESNNRLWGCKYGQHEGSAVNEIYASKLGDFKNWNSFGGISTDSYAASCGTDGPFTGAINHMGYPIFFKEDAMHKVYGNYPSNYQIQTNTVRGVQKGSSRSLAIVGSTLFYKSTDGICAYDGSLPQEISKALGDTHYSEAVGGAVGNKYYVCMKDDSDEYSVFVYDSGMWHKEDNTKIEGFCRKANDLYAFTEGSIWHLTNEVDKDIEWSAETGVLATTHTTTRSVSIETERAYVVRANLRIRLEIGAKTDVYIEYDSSGTWEHMTTISGTRLNSFTIPLRPKRCDHFRLKFVGKGYGEIHSIVLNHERGSDR